MKTCTVNDNAQDDQSPKQDIYARITAKIAAALEDGVRPWVRPWNAEHAAGRITRPLRHNGQHYTGINILSLWASASVQGFVAPIWMTYRQAVELGAHVRKGEKGSPVVYANSITRNQTDTDSGVEVARDIHFLKGYSVFQRRTDRRTARALHGAGVIAPRCVRPRRPRGMLFRRDRSHARPRRQPCLLPPFD